VSIEERLRDAFGAAAETVHPGTVRPCPAPRRRRPWILSGSRGRELIPLVTAATVAVIVTGASLATSLLAGGPQHAPGHKGNSFAGLGSLREAGGLPQYFMTVVGDFSPLTVRDVRTGKILGRVAAPRGTYYVAAVAGTEDDRTFLVAADGRCAVTLYRLRLDDRGHPGPLVPLGVTVRGVIANSGDLAVTPDGRIAAYAVDHCGGGTGEIGLINLRTHQVRRWTTSILENAGGLSLSADGSLLSFSELVPAGFVATPANRTGAILPDGTRTMSFKGPATLVLPASAPPGPAHARAHIVLPSVAAEAISNDGTQLYGCAALDGTRIKGILEEPAILSAYDARTGQRLRVLHSWPKRLAGDLCQVGRDASGRYLLVLRPGQFDVINIATGTLTAVLPTTGLPVNEAAGSIAW
jgi:hypothetical protein